MRKREQKSRDVGESNSIPQPQWQPRFFPHLLLDLRTLGGWISIVEPGRVQVPKKWAKTTTTKRMSKKK